METHAQYSIKHCLEMIAPFEASNQQLEDSQLQFYQFMVSIYRGMCKKDTYGTAMNEYAEAIEILKKHMTEVAFLKLVRMSVE